MLAAVRRWLLAVVCLQFVDSLLRVVCLLCVCCVRWWLAVCCDLLLVVGCLYAACMMCVSCLFVLRSLFAVGRRCSSSFAAMCCCCLLLDCDLLAVCSLSFVRVRCWSAFDISRWSSLLFVSGRCRVWLVVVVC